MTSLEDESKGVPDVAIIGIAGRFPGARHIEQFWRNLRDGVGSIQRLDDDALLAAGVAPEELVDPLYVKASPILEGVDRFDARFFGFSPREASVMDPAHRFFLEVAWEAMEHAGYTGLPDEGTVGVFAGSGAPLYMIENLRTNPDLMRSMGEFLVRHTGNDMNFLATRVSYEMDLRGPSLNVQTACSSALVALHMACRSLIARECTLALAGASTILFPHGQGYLYKEGEILSPDGHCRPFDAHSAGTVFGSGTGCVVLKRLQDALDDGDTIHAVVKGSAINNDGAAKVGYLAPGVSGQASVIEAALTSAGVSADSISYVETHGTGTLVGDPIEVEALNLAFRAHTDKRKFCAIGSVKSNIGHLGEAAAMASLIKAILALKHRELPPSLGYRVPNPEIDFDDSPFFVNDRLRPWRSEGPLRCGITALGAGGTNCHVILEEAPQPLAGEGARACQLLVLSAKTRSALEAAAQRLADAIERNPELDLADVAYTLALGRRAFSERRIVAVHGREEAIASLRVRDKATVTQSTSGIERSLVFMFPGGGAQYARMGAGLYETEDTYRDAVDECLQRLDAPLARELRALMFASEADAERATRELERPSLTLPGLFTVEYALAKLFRAWGLTPSAYVGHSMGEYVAACLSGVMHLEDALRLVVLRGQLFEAAEPGAMLSVPLSEAALRALMPAGLSIAAVNAPELSVASGAVPQICALEALLADRQIESTRIRIDVAAHSAMLDPVLERFRRVCRTIRFAPPTVPFVSNLTGRWITPEQAIDPEYWVQHLRSTVRFADCLTTLLAEEQRVLLEVGPGRTLSMLARAQATPVQHAYNSLRHPQEAASDLAYASTTLGRIWTAGVEIDWSAFYEGQLRNRVPLPAYPFEGESYWVRPGRGNPTPSAGRAAGKREDLQDWFYSVGWAEAPRMERAEASEPQRWLVIANDLREGRELARRLEEAGAGEAVLVTPAEQLAERGPKTWLLDFRSSEQFERLLRTFEERRQRFQHVVYMVGRPRRLPHFGAWPQLELKQALTQNFYAPTHLARALGSLSSPIVFTIVTSGIAQLDGQRIDPLRSTVLGPTQVTPREVPLVTTRCIDLPGAAHAGTRKHELLAQLLAELRAEPSERVVALRRHHRWVRQISPLKIPALPEPAALPWLRQGGVYLITGGLGGIGLEVARHLARHQRVKLALLTRSELPERTEWDRVSASYGPAHPVAQRIARLRELEELGATLCVVRGDVSSHDDMRRVLGRVRAELGELSGVFHAAGLMDDEPLMSKSADAMQRVLAPKIEGTLVLDALLPAKLDLFVLFSSVASLLGLPGQVDYTAANAFLDAFARDRAQRAPGRTLVINWNAWRDVGMAEAARKGERSAAAGVNVSDHPALDGYTDEPYRRVFVTDFSASKHWLLSEHRIRGSFALLPGTAFVELARASFASGMAQQPIELTNLTFLSPFQVPDGESRRLSIHVSSRGDFSEIAMHAGMDARGVPLVTGEARVYAGEALGVVDLGALRARCHVRAEAPRDGFLAQDFVEFGPRWANIVRADFGHGEAVLELSLPAAFTADLEAYALHPAMLDMATGAAQSLIPQVDLRKDFYVPVSYGRIVVAGGMPGHVFSHVRCAPRTSSDLAHFDVTLSDAAGRVFAQITRFTMKRVDRGSAMTAASTTSIGTRDSQRKNDALDLLLRDAIRPQEGLEALNRLLSRPGLVQAVASSVDVLAWQAQLDATSVVPGSEYGDAAPPAFARPDLASDFVPPISSAELALAQVWSELLGVNQIGVLDDFFELGGNSLVAVRMFAAIRRRFRVSLPLATLFDASTIRELAAVLESHGAAATPPQDGAADAPRTLAEEPQGIRAGEGPYHALVPINEGPGQPFFCVHGAGGNVLNFRELAQRLGVEQSFYGLQAKGVSGGEPASSIEEMAGAYIDAVRSARPRGPIVLGGYSGGGVVAYEMAQRLRAQGEHVTLVLLDTFHPGVRARPPSRSERFEYLFAEGLPYLTRTAQGKVQRVYEDHVRALRIWYTRASGTAMPHELREALITQAFDQAATRYVPKRYDGHVTLFRAQSPEHVFAHVGPELGWDGLIPNLQIVEVPGNHKSLMTEPNVEVIIRHLVRLIGLARLEDRPPVANDPFSSAECRRSEETIDVGVALRVSR